jgi:Ca2+-binding RTX toxin-like protein
VVAGGADGGVSLFTALPGGRLVHLDTLQNDETVPLDGINALTTVVTGAALQIFAGSDTETGLTRLSYDLSGLGAVRFAVGDGAPVSGTSGDDQIMGASVGEALFGRAGDDILFDGAGSDTMTGGAGADLFVLAADRQTDTILDFERGQDRLDLSAFDFLYDVGDLTITPTGTGATLLHGDEVIHVTTADGQPLSMADLTTDDILNVDRPPLLSIGLELVGGNFADSLTGGAGPDTLYGFGGADDLAGGFGSDLIFGGSENDHLTGGAGHDALHGQAGDDTLVGGFDDDLLMGNAGNDVIYGDDAA